MALAVLLLQGCAYLGGGEVTTPVRQVSQPPAPKQVGVRDIRDNADYTSPTCQRHAPAADGRRAFYGLRVNNCVGTDGRKWVYVVGFFSLNGSSPAEQAGIASGDRLESMKGCTVTTAGEVRAHLEETAPGSTAFVRVSKRNGQVATLPVRTGTFTPRGGDTAGRTAGANLCSTIGLEAAN